jgi:hypothetical protein
MAPLLRFRDKVPPASPPSISNDTVTFSKPQSIKCTGRLFVHTLPVLPTHPVILRARSASILGTLPSLSIH